MTTDMKKLARLADIFLDAADFPLNGNGSKLGKRVESALDADEKKIVDDQIFKAMVKKSQGSEDIKAETLALADVFAKASSRLGLEKQAANLLPIVQTDRKTEKELHEAGYPHLAHLVRVARKSYGG